MKSICRAYVYMEIPVAVTTSDGDLWREVLAPILKKRGEGMVQWAVRVLG